MQIDRGAYADAVTPWEDPGWRASALAWLDDQLQRCDVRETGPRRVRLRPWSVIIRVEAARPVWFKANPPGSAFEPALTETLSQWAPAYVLTPYAVDVSRGWALVPDGGPLLRTFPPDARHWEQLLVQYAELQRALVPRTGELLRLGVPDARLDVLPEIFDKLMVDNPTLGGSDRQRLQAFRPRLVEWCAELGAICVPYSLDHSDLHDGQILVAGPGRYTFFDWGDANVSHPFCSLLVALERAADELGAEVVPRLEAAYLEPWTADGWTTSDLHRAATLARRVAELSRATSWTRLFPTTTSIGTPQQATALLHLLPT